jgi:hypothetical protein
MESEETPRLWPNWSAAGRFVDRFVERYTRHWRLWLLLFWAVAAALMIFDRWNAIRWFALGDTDDNLRMMQVRALMEGQGWYDLRQYRMNPPVGADIHWSRLPDLPIAGIKYLLAPFMGGAGAEKVAVTLAPLLPMGVAMTALAVTARRLVSLKSFALAVGLLACAHSARGMWVPLRIDHHGWQLAMLAIVVMGIADPKRARGGAVVGVATALSLAIGMEVLPFLAIAGAVTVLMWVHDGGQARRLVTYGASLAGGCAFSFLVFASYANRAPVCDALSPVWLSAMVPAGALCVALAAWSPQRRLLRLAAAAAGGAAIAAAFALLWPHCLGRLEQSSPELEYLWLSRVREAMPVTRHGWRMAAVILSLPTIGMIGYAAMIWRNRCDGQRLIAWGGFAVMALLAAALLFWQTRAAAPAQLLSIPGATAIGWMVLCWFHARRNWILSTAGIVAAFLLISGLGTLYATWLVPEPPNNNRRHVEAANRRCPTLPALAPIARQPRGTVLTFVDLGPRLISVTPHNAIVGPYHRNAQQIIDVMRTWRGDVANALHTVRRYRVDYVLICPNLSESTVYGAAAPNGFYAQLARGKVPAWLQSVPLPADSPYRMWRVLRR